MQRFCTVAKKTQFSPLCKTSIFAAKNNSLFAQQQCQAFAIKQQIRSYADEAPEEEDEETKKKRLASKLPPPFVYQALVPRRRRMFTINESNQIFTHCDLKFDFYLRTNIFCQF